MLVLVGAAVRQTRGTSVPPILWRSDAGRIERASITGYTRWLERTRGLDLLDYRALWERPTTDLEGFWTFI